MADQEFSPQSLLAERAHVSLLGELTDERAADFVADLGKVPDDAPRVLIEATTPGGDAELARRLALEVELARKRLKRRLLFIGKTQLASAGIILMSAFARSDRFLTRDCILMIHSRQLEKTVELSGPLRLSRPKVQALLAEMEAGIRLEEENFRRLIVGSDIGLDEILEKALHAWHLTAEEAHRRGLVAGLL